MIRHDADSSARSSVGNRRSRLLLWGLLLAAGLVALLLQFNATKRHERDEHMSTTTDSTELKIWMGMRGVEMVRAHGGSEDRQPAGALFHEVEWGKKPFGTITLLNAHHSFSLPTVLYILSFTDNLFARDGVDSFTITAGVTPDEFVDHAEAHRAVFAFIDSLLAKGWEPYMEPAGAMLRGADALRSYMEDEIGFLFDARARPTLMQWMAVDSSFPRYTSLYANGVVMEISVRRDMHRLDLNQPGKYVLRLSINSAVGQMRTYVGAGNFSPEKAPTWTQYWPAKLKEFEANRVKETARLQAEGYKVDTSYRHPDWSIYLK